MSLWQICNGEQFITYLEGEMYRMVESQEQVATMSYVDSLQEQAVLETLLESAKPSYPDAIISASMGSELHYLLKTPFRYPPLPGVLGLEEHMSQVSSMVEKLASNLV
ncbi:MAG: hypothetical protein LRY63_03860 [Nitrincola sp.]|nr:hypothetical protein [Nitrincola sp.]